MGQTARLHVPQPKLFSFLLNSTERVWQMQQNNVLSYLTSPQQGNKHRVTANQIAHLPACLTLDGSPEKRWANHFCEGHTPEKKGEGIWEEWSGQPHGNSGLFDWWRCIRSQAGRPGNVIQGGCLNMTSLGAIQSAAKPSSGASPGTVAGRLQLWAHCLSTPLQPQWRKTYDGERRGEGRRITMEINIFLHWQCN